MSEDKNTMCACTKDYDSVTGENQQVTCDWCSEGSEGSEDGCYCEYSYDMDGRYLDYECKQCAKRPPLLFQQPPNPRNPENPENPENPGPWATEKATIGDFLYEVQMAGTVEMRLPIVERLFRYIMTVKPFLDTFPKMRAAVVAKVAELKADPAAVSILEVMVATEAFLAAA